MGDTQLTATSTATTATTIKAIATTTTTTTTTAATTATTATLNMKAEIPIPLKERRPRVLVEVGKNDLLKPIDDQQNVNGKNNDKLSVNGGGGGATAAPHNKFWEKKIDIINSSTLVFQMKCHAVQDSYRRVLNFDCVANGDTDQLIRWQMSALVDRLLINGRNNCCLLRIGPERSGPTLQILSHIIIPEISKRLTSPEMSPLLLYAIRIEYYDVRKYDVVNMVLRAAPKSKPRHHVTLRNTWELLQWVQDTYPTLWAQGAGHECMDLKFIFVRDQSGTKVRIKLSIVYFFLNKMDADMTAGLRNFMENSGSTNNGRIKHSILTDYLREYFFSPENWHIWMLFKVPSNKKGEIANDMLTLASSAYAGVQSLIDGRITTETSIFKEYEMERDFLCPIINTQTITTNGKLCTPIRCSASNSAAQIALRFQKKDKQSLSYWYRQMDEKFLNVLLTMEAFYTNKNKSNNKNNQNIDLKNGSRTKERREFISTVRNTPKQINNDVAMKLLTSNYKQAVVALHTLIQQVERSPYARLLKVLVQMKNNELVQHLTHLREKNAAALKTKRSNKADTTSNSLRTKFK